MGEGHIAKGGDNMMVWENLLPTFNFSFHADSKPSSAVQPPSICVTIANCVNSTKSKFICTKAQ